MSNALLKKPGVEPPQEPVANIMFRKELRAWALKSKRNRNWIIDRCSEDWFFFAEAFLWLYEPRPDKGRPAVIPFLPWSHQRPEIEKLLNGLGYEDFGIEKSRGEGATWSCLMIIFHRWLFREMQAFGIVSRHEQAADNPEDPDSLGWKCLSVGTPVLTPSGWAPIESLGAGDHVISPSGDPIEVSRSIPVHTSEIYRVHFSDGTWVDCSNNHPWPVTTCNQRLSSLRSSTYEEYKIISTEDLAESIRPNLESTRKHWNYQIPQSEGADFSAKELPIDPYILGVLIGDGSLSKTGVTFASVDEEIVNNVRDRLPNGYSITPSGKCSFFIVGGNGKNEISRSLKTIGLRGKRAWEKFVPEIYKFSSRKQRLEILKGLMDTDGGVKNDSGMAVFYTSSEDLANDVCFIVRSLGGVSVVNETKAQYKHKGKVKRGRPAYRVSVSFLSINPFKLARKASSYKHRKHTTCKRITKVEPIGEGKVACISVDSADRLFVIKDFIVTHNCDWQITMLPKWMVGERDKEWTRNVAKHTWKRLDNGSTITAYPCTGDLASGGRKTCFFMDEFGKFPRGPDEEAISAVEPVTNSLLLVSTYDGADGAYYRAMNEDSSMKKLVLAWENNPTRNQNLFRVDIKKQKLIDPEKDDVHIVEWDYEERFFDEYVPILVKRGFDLSSKLKLWSPWYVSRCLRPRMTPRKIAQEYDRDAGRSGSRFFSQSLIESLIHKAERPYLEGEIECDFETLRATRFTEMKEGHLKLWTKLRGRNIGPPIAQYVLGVDIASGQGGDQSTNSAISIVNRDTGRKVGEYANPQIKPEQLAELAIALCHWFRDPDGNPGYLIWEGNGYGGSFRDRVMETSFRNFHWRTPWKSSKKKPSKEPGWWSNKDSKRDLLGKYRWSLGEGFFDNPHAIALKECLAYQNGPGGKVEFKSGMSDDDDPANDGENHGDRVIADALANYGMEELNGGTQLNMPKEKANRMSPPPGSFRERQLGRQKLAKKKDMW